MSDEQSREVEARDDERVRRELRRLSRRGFLGLAAGAGAVVFGWRWLLSRPMADRLPAPFRSSLEANAALWQALNGMTSFPTQDLFSTFR